jgi:hypothetical protein
MEALSRFAAEEPAGDAHARGKGIQKENDLS